MKRYWFVIVTLCTILAGCSRSEPIPAGLASSALTSSDKLTFLAVGRQGYNNEATAMIARAMENVAAGQPVDFVVQAGDNFYPQGVASTQDPQWRTSFEELYTGEHLEALPFYAVAGNHDHQGNVAAELDYARLKLGSGRWHMPHTFYSVDFGNAGERVLARLVFLDTVPMLEQPARQIQFLREQMRRAGDPVWRIVVGHYPARSLTKNPFSRKRVMHSLIEVCRQLDVDLYVSANDRFQQLLRRPGEPLHLSTNGGGEKLEKSIAPRLTDTEFVQPQRGFATISLDGHSLTVDLLDTQGRSHYRQRLKK